MIGDEATAKAWFAETLRLDTPAIDRLDEFARMLLAENQRQNLISRKSESEIWLRHFLDAAQLLTVSRGTSNGGPWLDLGTGAGFPGLVIALCRPAIAVHVVDSRRLRADWLKFVADTLALPNVTVHHARVESLPELAVSTISARAFAPLEKLLTISARFSTPATLWLLPKGASAAKELAGLGRRWNHAFHVEQSITDPSAGIVVGHLLDETTARLRADL